MVAGLRYFIGSVTAEARALSFEIAKLPRNQHRALPVPADQTKVICDGEGRAAGSEMGVGVGKGRGGSACSSLLLQFLDMEDTEAFLCKITIWAKEKRLEREPKKHEIKLENLNVECMNIYKHCF